MERCSSGSQANRRFRKAAVPRGVRKPGKRGSLGRNMEKRPNIGRSPLVEPGLDGKRETVGANDVLPPPPVIRLAEMIGPLT